MIMIEEMSVRFGIRFQGVASRKKGGVERAPHKLAYANEGSAAARPLAQNCRGGKPGKRQRRSSEAGELCFRPPRGSNRAGEIGHTGPGVTQLGWWARPRETGRIQPGFAGGRG